MNAIGVASMIVAAGAWLGAGGCVPYVIWLSAKGVPHLGLRALKAFFAFFGFVVLAMLAFIVGITAGHVSYHSP